MQPQLVLIANHALTSTAATGPVLPDVRLFASEIHEYCLRYTQLTNQQVENTEAIWPKGESDCRFSYLDIQVNIQKHIIQLKFPFIYRAFFDFTPLRLSIFNMLKPVFTAYGTTECAAHPSRWDYSWIHYNNEWKLQRLEQMQQKILFQCTSYKRTILNLTHCLGEPCHTWQSVSHSNYLRWWQGSAYMENNI